MQWIGEAWRRLMFFFRRGQFHRDLEEEINDHVRMKAEDLRKEGFSSEEAQCEARQEFGNALLLRETSRDAWGFRWLETLLQDLRYGLRQLCRNPGFTVVAVVTLALGIGANAAIYSLAYSVLLRNLPVKDPRGLVVMQADFPKWPAGLQMNGGSPGSTFSYPAFRAFSNQRRVFASVFGFAPPDIGKENLTMDIDGRAATANGAMVTGAYFSGLGIRPALGRTIASPDEERTASRVADISFGYWARVFGKSLAAIGKRVAVNRTPFTIVGVLPPGFTGAEPGNTPDIWIPITANANLGPWGGMPASVTFNRGSFAWMTVMGRLKAGVSRSQAAAAVTLAFQRNLEASLGRHSHPDEMPRVELLPGGRGLNSLRESFSRPLAILIALAGFLLLFRRASPSSRYLWDGRQRDRRQWSATTRNRGRT